MEQNLITAIEQMKNGSEEGFNTVYSNTYNRVYFRAKQLMKKEEDAQDLVQIVFVEAYRNISSLQSAEALYGWLDGITYNQGMKLFRKQRDVLLTEEAEGMFDTLENNDVSAMPELTADQKETAAIIKGIIEELPELQRAAVVAYYYDGLKVEKIADLMECSVGTIKSRLNYARKYIKERVEEKEKKEGYRLHVFGLPVLYFALRMLATETKLAASAAQGVYNSACVSLGLQATVLGATGAAAAGGSATGATSATTAAGMSAALKALIISGVVLLSGLLIGGGIYFATRDTGREVIWEKYDDSDKKDKPEREPDDGADASEEETEDPWEDLPEVSMDEIDLSEYRYYLYVGDDEEISAADSLYLRRPDTSGSSYEGYWTVGGQDIHFIGKVGQPFEVTALNGKPLKVQMTVCDGTLDAENKDYKLTRIYWDIPYAPDSEEWQELINSETSYYYYWVEKFPMDSEGLMSLMEEYTVGLDFDQAVYYDMESRAIYDGFKVLFPKKDTWDYSLLTAEGNLEPVSIETQITLREYLGPDRSYTWQEIGDYLYHKSEDIGLGDYSVSYQIYKGSYRLMIDLIIKENSSSVTSPYRSKVIEICKQKLIDEFFPAFEATLLSNLQ